MAAPIRRTTVRSNYNALASTVIMIPNDAQVGDWLVVVFYDTGSTATAWTPPSGWTQLIPSVVTGTRNAAVFAGRRLANDAATYTFTRPTTGGTGATTAGAVSYSVLAFTGGDIVTPNAFVNRANTAAMGAQPGTGGITKALSLTPTVDNSLVIAIALEATSAAEATAPTWTSNFTYWGGVEQNGSDTNTLNTIRVGYQEQTTKQASGDWVVTYPNVQASNGAGVQLYVKPTVDAPPSNVATVVMTADFETTNPFTQGSTFNFETSTAVPRSGTTGLRRLANANIANHSQVSTSQVFTPPTLGYRYIGYVRLDAGVTPNLAGLSVGNASDGSGGVQALIDSRNAASGGTASLQIRSNMNSSPLASAVSNFPVTSGTRYRIEMDWLATSPNVKARFYEDATNKFLGSVEGGTTASSGGVGVYAYNAASFDDITMTTMVPYSNGMTMKILTANEGTVDGYVSYFDGGKRISINSAWAMPFGRKVDKLMADGKKFVMAHRGGSIDYAEMSLRGYTQAVSLGCTGLEFSVARTSDGVFFGLHDADLNRTSPSVGSTSYKPGEHTWAEISQLIQVVGNADTAFGPQPYMKLEDMLNTYARSHTIFIDPKVVGSANIGPLIDYLKTFQDYQNTFVGKYFHSGFVEVARRFRAAGMKTWGYYYTDDLAGAGLPAGNTKKAVSIAETAAEWDYLGLSWDAPQAAWDEVLAYGKPVIGHIVPNLSAAQTAFAKGASGVMASGIRSVMSGYVS